MALFQAKVGRKRKKKEIIVPFRSYTTCNRKFQKNSKKIQKIKKIALWLYFKTKIGQKSPGTKEKRNYRSIPFPPDA